MIKNFGNLTRRSSDFGQKILHRGKASQIQPRASANARRISPQFVFDREDKYGAHNYHPIPVALSRGKGKPSPRPNAKNLSCDRGRLRKMINLPGLGLTFFGCPQEFMFGTSKGKSITTS